MAAGAVDDRVPHPERERSFHIWIDPRRPGQEGALIHLRILLAAVAVTFASALALASSVQAHDCGARIQSIPDVGSADSIQDCLRTGQTYGVTIGAVVAGVGVVIAIVGLPGRRPAPPPRPASPPPPVQRREPEPPHHADPCFDQQVRHTTARAGARTTFNALQTLRTQRGYLESLWESTRETGYLSAVVDVGMMAGSLWTKPLAAGLGMTLAKQALAQKAAESVLKALGTGSQRDGPRARPPQPMPRPPRSGGCPSMNLRGCAAAAAADAPARLGLESPRYRDEEGVWWTVAGGRWQAWRTDTWHAADP